jgi:segregation and condensation protein B
MEESGEEKQGKIARTSETLVSDSIQKSKISDEPQVFDMEESKEELIDPFQQIESKKEETPESAKAESESPKMENLKKVEAALFVAGRWLSLQELITLTDINPISIKEHIQKLSRKYKENNSVIEILEKDNMWKMDVHADYVNIVNKLITGSSEFTKSEQETLAVIAYKQPVKQSVIIKIRGNKAYDHVKKFISLGLAKAKKEGHTLNLQLSEEFYNYFGLEKEKSK